MANATEWSKRVTTWRASGLSAEKFCANKDYTAKSLWHWSSRLKQSSGSKSSPRGGVHDVPVARLVRDGDASACTAGAVVVELHGARIEVRGSVDASTLRSVFEIMREASLGRPR